MMRMSTIKHSNNVMLQGDLHIDSLQKKGAHNQCNSAAKYNTI